MLCCLSPVLTSSARAYKRASTLWTKAVNPRQWAAALNKIYWQETPTTQSSASLWLLLPISLCQSSSIRINLFLFKSSQGKLQFKFFWHKLNSKPSNLSPCTRWATRGRWYWGCWRIKTLHHPRWLQLHPLGDSMQLKHESLWQPPPSWSDACQVPMMKFVTFNNMCLWQVTGGNTTDWLLVTIEFLLLTLCLLAWLSPVNFLHTTICC